MTDSNFTSTIPEPDASKGEVAWVDRNIPVANNVPIEMKTGQEVNGVIYYARNSGSGNYSIGYMDINTNVYTDVFVDGGEFNSSVKYGKYVYFFADKPDAARGGVVKYDTETNSALKLTGVNITTKSNTYIAAAVTSSGVIYATGFDTDHIIRVSTSTDDVAYVTGTLAQNVTTGITGANGNVYFMGEFSKILEINLNAGQTVFGTLSDFQPISVSVLSENGFIYNVGNTQNTFNAPIYKVNTDNKTISIVNIVESQYATGGAIGNDLYFFPDYKDLPVGFIKFNTVDNSFVTLSSVSEEGDFAINYDGKVYAYGTNVIVLGDYKAGEQVISTDTHRIYEAAIDSDDNPVDGVNKIPPSWVDLGATNKYAMFDESIISTSTDGSPIVITHTAGISVTAVAMFGVNGANNVNVTVNSISSGEVYNRDVTLTDNSSVIDGWTYYFEPIIKGDKFVLLDLPPYADTTVTVTITGGVDIAVGSLIFGGQVNVGVTNYNTEIQLIDFSSRKRDEFGNFKIVRRATADLVKFDVTIQKSKVSYVRRQFQDLSQVAAVFVGGDGSIDDPTVIYGYYENFINNISSPSVTDSTITIQGVV